MSSHSIPARIRWAVSVLEVQAADQVLEIGGGSGEAAGLVADRLGKGKVMVIDRSEAAVDRTRRTNAHHVEAGRMTVRHIDLATLRVPIKRLDKAFAINVNLFWVRDCLDEVALLHERLSPGGTLHLFFEAKSRDEVKTIVQTSSATLTKAGFRVSLLQHHRPPMICVIGRK